MMMKKEAHKTLKMPLKMIEVDRKIAPAVRWLNSFPSVHTLYSCQGSEKRKHQNPYVLFSCNKFADLCKIVNYLSQYSKTRVEIMPSCDLRTLTYQLAFANQAELETFVGRLPERFH
jgi:hypothetical protein